MNRQPLNTHTLYAELLEQLVALEARRSVGSLPGCFTTKTVKGAAYWYYQQSLPGGGHRQVYLGRRGEVLDRVVALFNRERPAVRADEEEIRRLCAQLRAGEALATDAASARVLAALSDAGFFRCGGVLVGTHAFIALGNVLGIRWEGAALRTADIDVAAPRRLEVAFQDAGTDIPLILDQLRMGFSPVPALDHRHPSTSFSVRGKALRLDLLTPETGAGGKGPVAIPRLNAAAQPLRFLDFLMSDAIPAGVIDGGGVLARVPAPARFALHKLLVNRERGAHEAAKAAKDLHQAAQVIEALAEDRPGDLESAWDDLASRGAGWVKRVQGSRRDIKGKFPRAADALAEVTG